MVSVCYYWEGQEWNSSSTRSHPFRLCLTLSVTLSASLKQKEETIRELAALLAFLFFPVLDTLVQPVCSSSLCQLARVPRRQSVSEGSYERLGAAVPSLLWSDCSACAGNAAGAGTGASQHWDNHGTGDRGAASPLWSPLQMVLKLTSSSLSFWRK